jgi:carboxyl-terminal processing protease
MRVAARTLALLCALGAPTLTAQDPPRPTRPRTLAEDLQLFSQVMNQIRVNHPDSVDSHAILMSAIEGLVRAVDPHSYVIPAVRFDASRQRALEEGKLAPLPIVFAYIGRVPSVVSVGPGTGAAKQDIAVGDELIAIDGAPAVAESDQELYLTLAGKKGSSVLLKLQRTRLDGSSVVLERSVRREHADEATAVPTAVMLDATTGYVRITSFDNQRVDEDMRAAIGRLEREGMQRMVLDLRDNPGGMVDEASNVAGEFLPRGLVVYTTEGKRESLKKSYKVPRSFWRKERSFPLVVLVNRGSASAAELLAGALQDHDRALIVGRPSFGKALLMQGLPLSDGSLMMLVIGRVRTPCGRIVQREYRGMREADYRRDAAAERDTTGRPSCKTGAGRTLYGGGGIFPDIVLDLPTPTPVWIARLGESELLTKWAGAYMAQGRAPDRVEAYLDQSAVPASAVADFRTFARSNGAELVDGAAADAALRRELVAALARVKLGDGAYYRVLLRDDPWITHALKAFERASLLRGPDGS